MLLCKQPGDTGIYATATPSQVRLYYILDRVFPLVSAGAAAAEASGVLGRGSGPGFGGIDTSTTALGSPAEISPDLLSYVTRAPACVPREYLRTLCRLSPFSGDDTTSVTAAAAGGGAFARPTSLAALASPVHLIPPPHTGPGGASSTSDDRLPPHHEDLIRDIDPAHHWGTSLTPFHTVPCGLHLGDGAGEGQLSSPRGGLNTPPQEWAAPTLPTAGSTSISGEENGLGQFLAHTVGDLAVGYGGYYAGNSQSLARRAGGGAAHASSTTSDAALSTIPTTLSLSCATDCLLFFVANSEGLSWIGRSDATSLSPLRISTSLQTGRRSAGRYGRSVGGGDSGVVSSTPRLPRPFSANFGVTMNASFPTQSLSTSARAVTPTNAALVVASDEDGDDDDGGGGGGGVGVKYSRRRKCSVGVASPSLIGGAQVDGGGTLSPMAGFPSRRTMVSRHDRIVTASGWDPRNSAILALGRQSGAVQLLDVEYVAGSVDSGCCSSTTTSHDSSEHDTAEPLTSRATGGLGAGPSTLGGGRVVGGTHLAPYAGADHLSYSVVQQRLMLGPVTALDWMPQSHLTVVAARRHDGLGFYAQLLDLRASHDGVTYLGAPPEVFGVPSYARSRDSNAPRVLCSAEHVACHPSQRYVATVGASRLRDIVQLWDVRMTTRPVACQVYTHKGYTSLCWGAAEAGVVLATTRDGGLRAHVFDELAPSRTSLGRSAVVPPQHYGSAASPQSPRGFGSGGASGGRGTGRSHRRRTLSGGILHHQTTSGGEQEVDRWGLNNSNLLHSGCSGTEDELLDDSCSFRSGFSAEGAGAAVLLADRNEAMLHPHVKAQSALKCQLPSRVPAAAVGWVCHPLSEPAKSNALGGAPVIGSGRTHTGGVMSASGTLPAERLNTTRGSASGPLPIHHSGGGRTGDVMARGCRTDLPQLVLLNAANGELYTQVYNPGGSTVTHLDNGTVLVAAGPNAFLSHPSKAYRTASYVHEEAVLDQLERQAAAAAAVTPVSAAVDAASGMTASGVYTPISSGPGSNVVQGLIDGRRGASGRVAVVAPVNQPTISNDGAADGAQSSHARSSSTGGTGVGAPAATASSDTVPAARLKGWPVDFIGLGFLDEVGDEEEEEEEERGTLPVTTALTAKGDYENRITADSSANKQPSSFGAASPTSHVSRAMGTQGGSGTGVSDGTASGVSPRARGRTGTEPALLGAGGAASPKGARRSGTHDTFFLEEESINTLGPLRTPVAVSSHSPSAPTDSVKEAYTATSSAPGRVLPKSKTAPVSVPQELGFSEFHRIERTRHLWWRLRSGFACDPLHNLAVLLREGVDREAYTTFLYGCCAAQLLFPSSVTAPRDSRNTGSVVGPAASSPSVVLSLRQAVPGLLELLASERDSRQQLGLSDTRLSSEFRLDHHRQSLAGASEADVVLGSASPCDNDMIGPIGAMALPSPLFANLSSSMERHGRPPGFPRDPFSAAAAGIRGCLSPQTSHLTGTAMNAGVGRTASSSHAGGTVRQGTAGGAARHGVANRPTYSAAIGMLRELVLQSMGWTTPPPVCIVDRPTGQTAEGGGADTTGDSGAGGAAQAAKLPPLHRSGQPSHPAERFFVQGDGIGQHSLQEALERRVAVLVLLDRHEEAAELLALYGTHNAQYPSIALTLSAARDGQTTLINLATVDSSGVTFWVHLMLTYEELLMHQQFCTTSGSATSPPGQAEASERIRHSASSNARSNTAAMKPVSRFDDCFELAQQKEVVLRLLERYPRLILSDKVALGVALLLPSSYHSGHITNLMEVLQILVEQQYRGSCAIATAAEAPGADIDRARGIDFSTASSPGAAAHQERRVDAQRRLPAGLLSSSAQSSSLCGVASPRSFSDRIPNMPSDTPAYCTVESHRSNPDKVFISPAVVPTASVGNFFPVCGCSLLLVTVVGGVSTDWSALQRYVDETSDLQTSLSYAAVFGDILSSDVYAWRDAYRQLLNNQGFSMWRSQHDLQMVKLVHAREEAGKRGGGGTACGGSIMHTGGVMGAAGSTVPCGGVASDAAAGAPASGHGAVLLGTGIPRTKGFPSALGSLGGDLGTASGPSTAAAMMLTQTAMMMERTLNRFAQTTATTATDRDRSLREISTAVGGANSVASEAHHRGVELRCNCGQAMHATARSKSTITSMTSTNMSRKQLIPCGNPECRQWQTPMCTVCGERMEHRATELPPGRFFGWCSVCLHGGHWCHLREWFSKHTKCPVENCPCHCCDSVHLS